MLLEKDVVSHYVMWEFVHSSIFVSLFTFYLSLFIRQGKKRKSYKNEDMITLYMSYQLLQLSFCEEDIFLYLI